MRKHLRAMARANMRRAGLTRVNKKRRDGSSFFAKHWREWV